MIQPDPLPAWRQSDGSAAEVFVAFLRLGLTSFGGPTAHLGYFRRAFVEERRWLGEAEYAELVALAQLLPGPASSQVGFALGLRRAGWTGGLAAFTGFTLPSATLMVLFAAYAGAILALPGGQGLVHGLKLAAVAVVAQAVIAMGSSLSRGPARLAVTVAAAILALLIGGFAGQAAAIVMGAVAGALALEGPPVPATAPAPAPIPRPAAIACLALAGLVLALSPWLGAFGAFFRSGALVFGGGHVVAPLLAEAVVEPGWIARDAFLQGYGAAQALPGPLFTFAAYLGALRAGPLGAVLATIAIFAPGLLLMAGALPFWSEIGRAARPRAALAGVNAAVVGLLAAALYDPIGRGAITGAADLVIVAAALALLLIWKAPPLAAVVLCALAGLAVSLT